MRMLHLGLALALLVGSTVSVEAAKEKGKKKKAGGTTGVVTAVTTEKDGTKSITVKVHQGKKNKDTAAVEKKFKVISTTKFQTLTKVKGQKGPGEAKDALVGDVTEGSRVTIQTGSDDTVADTVSILPKGKKNKNK